MIPAASGVTGRIWLNDINALVQISAGSNRRETAKGCTSARYPCVVVSLGGPLCPKVADASAGNERFGKIKINERTRELLEAQLEGFRAKFGRDPGPSDPVVFDPSKDRH